MAEATENQLKALKIIRDNPKIKGLLFANLMWSDSTMHKQPEARVRRSGNYYLFNLVKRHWVTEHNWKFELTKEGLRELNNSLNKLE